MRQLRFPLRADNASEPKPAAPGAGTLSDQDLTTRGFEQRVLKRLTEECEDFGATYRCKKLEEDTEDTASLGRKLRAFGFETAQINHAVNASDWYEAQEGLLYMIMGSQ